MTLLHPTSVDVIAQEKMATQSVFLPKRILNISTEIVWIMSRDVEVSPQRSGPDS